MEKFLTKLKNKKNLSFEESKAAFEILMNGKASEAEIFDFLTFLSVKGEVSDEIAGGVFVLRNKSKRVNVTNCIDTCGTGGDGKNTLNISSSEAFPFIKISKAALLSSKSKFSLFFNFFKNFSIYLKFRKFFNSFIPSLVLILSG